MKKRFLIFTAVLCMAVICSSFFFSGNAQKSVEKETVSVSSAEANLLSMLNHNFVYGSDFDDADVMVSRSVNALRAYGNAEEGIDRNLIADFVFNMYGEDIVDISSLDCGTPKGDLSVYYMSSGDTKYRHSNIKLTENEDGTITAVTDVLAENGINNESYTATSLFVPNDNSAFGFNIIYSELSQNGTSL
ncbi:MAG: hypothetical protein MJ090_06110 [Clostridia bacterium]|nr:hypothetical protein [Clostridia bacterium]